MRKRRLKALTEKIGVLFEYLQAQFPAMSPVELDEGDESDPARSPLEESGPGSYDDPQVALTLPRTTSVASALVATPIAITILQLRDDSLLRNTVYQLLEQDPAKALRSTYIRSDDYLLRPGQFKYIPFEPIHAETRFVAVIAGWVTTEVGRQPYTVYGHLLTADSISPIAAPAAAPSTALANWSSPPDFAPATPPMIAEVNMVLEYVGEAEKTVAAGTFACRHFRFSDEDGGMAGANGAHPVYDVWVKDCAMSFPGEEAPVASPSGRSSGSTAPAASPSPSASPAPAAPAPAANTEA